MRVLLLVFWYFANGILDKEMLVSAIAIDFAFHSMNCWPFNYTHSEESSECSNILSAFQWSTHFKQIRFGNRHLSLLIILFRFSGFFNDLDFSHLIISDHKNDVCKWCRACRQLYVSNVNIKLLRSWLSIDLYKHALINLFINIWFFLSLILFFSYCRCVKCKRTNRRIRDHIEFLNYFLQRFWRSK